MTTMRITMMRQLTRVIFLRLLSVWVTHATSAPSLATSPRAVIPLAPAVEATPGSARVYCENFIQFIYSMNNLMN